MKTLKSSVSNIVASLALVGGLALVSGNHANAVSFNYANRAGASISFPGNGTFSFTPGLGNFEVTSGSANTFLGEFTGTFAIGAITTVGPLSSAPVTGTGTMVIHDPADGNLTAALTWVDIQQIAAGGSLNVVGDVNLTGITYTGSNPDLLALATAGSGGNVLSFQFATVISLADLKSGAGGNATSFSGTINSTSVPDGGLTVGLLGLALVGLSVVRLTLKKAAA
jgi:hypothetical protein